MEESQAEDFLRSLLNKNLRITTSDSRLFLGQFKCTDSELNIILAHTFEYRFPTPPKTSPSQAQSENKTTVTMDMTSRYLGLVVVPGEHIAKIEVEEFVSQMKGQTVNGEDESAGRQLEGVV